jgi:hypothetical protein
MIFLYILIKINFKSWHIVIRPQYIITSMKQKFSSGTKCECMCHGKAGILEYCGYCATSHRKVFSNQKTRR